MLKKEDIINFLRDNKKYLLDKYNIEIFALYGSYSRNEATENSDIDLVYQKRGSVSYKSFFEAEDYLNENLKKKIELVNIEYMNPVIRLTAEKDFIYV